MSNQEKKSVESRNGISTLLSPEKLDGVRATLISSIALIPGYGGNLATALDQWLPDWKFQRLESFVEELREDSDRYKECLDEQSGKFEEQSAELEGFALMFEHVSRQVAQTPGTQKRKAYRALLLNACLPSAPERGEQDFFLSRVDRMLEVHVAILSMLAKAPSPDIQVAEWIGKQPQDVLYAAAADLEAMGLIRHDGSIGGHLQHRADYRYLTLLLPLGERLVKFITLPTGT